VRIVAVRAALRLANRRKERRPEMPPFAAAADPELDYLKLRYRSQFEEAFRSALAALSTRERLMLKLHSVDGLSIDKIAAAYHLHRSNVARRLASIRRLLRDQTVAEIQQRLGVSPREVESLLALVRSQIWVSVRRALQQR
jgi:RNA polymerase sigma-70 factor (ECF subfamily)